MVLSRRSARSLKAFLDEASEVMQFHVRKLYTAEGRRVRGWRLVRVWLDLGWSLTLWISFSDRQRAKPDDLSRGLGVCWPGIL